MKLVITDETLVGKVTNRMEFELLSETITAKELIERRVTHEVEVYNSKLTEYFNGLVEPTDAELTLNGYKMKKVKKIDIEKQVYVALDAFQKNGFFMLVDDKQIDSLDSTLTLHPNSRISFVKLMPLVGG